MIPTPAPGMTYAPNMVPFPTFPPGFVPTPAPGFTYAPGLVPTIPPRKPFIPPTLPPFLTYPPGKLNFTDFHKFCIIIKCFTKSSAVLKYIKV